MSDIILKTYEFIDALEESEMINNLVLNRDKLLKNEKALSLVNKYNTSLSDEEKLRIKKELYTIDEYNNYMKNYNDLSLLVMRINKKYKDFTSSKKCHKKD